LHEGQQPAIELLLSHFFSPKGGGCQEHMNADAMSLLPFSLTCSCDVIYLSAMPGRIEQTSLFCNSTNACIENSSSEIICSIS
jgi:hypothetical protein